MTGEDLYQSLLAQSKEAIYDQADKLKIHLDQWQILAPLLIRAAQNECKMIRVRYEAHIANGFSEEQALTLAVKR